MIESNVGRFFQLGPIERGRSLSIASYSARTFTGFSYPFSQYMIPLIKSTLSALTLSPLTENAIDSGKIKLFVSL